ncbi:unnamed protein product [Meganyctiphanes norvegica]|uniref:SEC7 domain-containing protein n=1 Tax=Meganyctiphanes norvegica TaxID=48144 RepID=A0AAV2PY31_MEGNR
MLHENNLSEAGGTIGPPAAIPSDKSGLNYSLISDKMDVSMIENHRPTICFGRIIIGEITPLLAAMRRTVPRWSSHQLIDADKDPLVIKLEELSATITALNPDDTLDCNTFLDPFLAVIRSEDTTGPVTKIALASVNRILNYGLISPECSSASAAVESVAAAVTHARFVGTDQGADEVVLWEILTVLRTLMLGTVGHLLTNESVCEILNSSFRICFETRLSELLRNCTEEALRHMVQLLFARLPQFKDDPRGLAHFKRLKMRAGGEAGRRKGKRASGRPSSTPTPPPQDIPVAEDAPDTITINDTSSIQPEDADSIAKDEMTATTGITPSESDPESLSVEACDPPAADTASVDSGILEAGTPGEKLDVSNAHLAPNIYSSIESIPSAIAEADGACISAEIDVIPSNEQSETKTLQPAAVDVEAEVKTEVCSPSSTEKISPEDHEEFINSQGVKFTQEGVSIEGGTLVPYGMPCVKEVFRFLISLTSPTNEQNTPAMISTSLNLLIVAFEVGAEHINNTPSLLGLLKDQLYRNLLMLLKPDVRLTIFMASLRCCTLLCEALRSHFKFQLEMLLNKLSDIITSEAPNISYAHKKLALETIIQLWRIPGLITELFLNFDCDLYASNLFEDLTKVLSKNAFPVQGIYSTNLLSLDALITVIDIIENHTNKSVEAKEVKNKSDSAPLVLSQASSGYLLGLGLRGGFCPVTPVLKARSVLVDSTEVSRENLVALKERKKLLAAGTDQFNAKPEKGIKFLQDNNIIGSSNDDIAVFLKENPKLCKKQIGEYASKKKNVDILAAFVMSFDFCEQRIDQSLRAFLETFRLPGEAPVISIIIEHFSDHWHKSNNEPFEKADAAFTLAYAVIMLNVDQHNQNAKKQNVPMTVDQFRKNVRGVNDGKDFDQDMLEEIYNAICSDEIVMPAEQIGLVKENYMWKMLLKRGSTKDGKYILANGKTIFDRDLFNLCWGPTIASLSYLFDKSTDEQIMQRSLDGFHKCASIAARFGMSDVFDNMIISLCKFTTLTATPTESPEQIVINFGANKKAQKAAKTVFQLVTTHGDILRDGWKNILDLLLQLFRCRLLPTSLVECEDFVDASGKVLLMREIPVVAPRQESNFLSSLSYFVLGDGGAARGTSPEDAEYTEAAKACILGCHPEKIITESAFLRCDSLTELLKALMGAGDASNLHEAGVTPGNGMLQDDGGQPQGMDEHCQAFLLECVVQVLIANKDRASLVWQEVRNHIYSLMMGAAAAERHFLLERCVVSLLRLAKVLLRRPGLTNLVLQSLRMLLLLKPHVLSRVALHIVAGIREVLSVNTEHIHTPSDWAVLFNLLECAGAGAKPPSFGNPTDAPQTTTDSGSLSESEVCSSGVDSGHGSEAGTTSDSEAVSSEAKPTSTTTTTAEQKQQQRAASPDALQNGPGGWILVGRGGEIEPQAVKVSINEFNIVHQRELGDHRPEALVQAFETLAFLVRDNRITPASLPAAVHAARTFVEATLNGGKSGQRPSVEGNVRSPTRRRAGGRRKEEKGSAKRSKSPSSTANAYDADESDSDDMPANYQHLSERLLDLLDNLHTSSGKIVAMDSETPESSLMLWHQALCPLLQGIARYCCDSRAQIRNIAMTNLQRALLNHDLQTLNAAQWEACFSKVLFPLLAALLQPIPGTSPSSLEETRVRAATLVQKVYLRHLTPLLALPTFTALWLTVLDFMDKYLNTHRSDHLNDAIPEILKNMLLVMETTQVFHTADGFTRLWTITWDRIDAFLPEFRNDLFKTHPPSEIHPIEVVPESGKPPLESSSEVPTATSSAPVPVPVTSPTRPPMSLPLSPPMAPPPDAPEAVGGMSPTTRESKDGFVPPTLREQQAARLSLSQECLPGPCSLILQPPAPIPTLTNPLPTLALASPTSPQANVVAGPQVQPSAFECSPSPLRPASILFGDSPDSDFLVDPNACQGPSPLAPCKIASPTVGASPVASREGSFDNAVPAVPLLFNAESVNPQPISILPISPQQGIGAGK